MRTIILTVLMVLMTTVMVSQNRLGYTFDEVKTEFNYERYDMCTKEFKKNTYIQITQVTAVTLFTFDKDMICSEVMMTPTSESHLTDYLDLFDERFEKVQHHKWYGTANEQNFKIILNEGGQFKFNKRK